MRATTAFLFVLLGLLATSGPAPAQRKDRLPAAVKDVLNKAEQLELYSLEPGNANKDDKPETLHGWKVLGKTTVKDARARKELIEAAGKPSRKGGAKCFEPRHAIRATHAGKTVDLVICFECSWVYVYEGDKETAKLTVDRKEQPAFDRVLREAKVPLPKKPK